MKKLLSLLRRCVHPFSVSQVLADFEQKLTQLRHVYEQRVTIANANTDVIQKLTIQNVDHIAEAKKTAEVEEKIRSLLS